MLQLVDNTNTVLFSTRHERTLLDALKFMPHAADAWVREFDDADGHEFWPEPVEYWQRRTLDVIGELPDFLVDALPEYSLVECWADPINDRIVINYLYSGCESDLFEMVHTDERLRDVFHRIIVHETGTMHEAFHWYANLYSSYFPEQYEADDVDEDLDDAHPDDYEDVMDEDEYYAEYARYMEGRRYPHQVQGQELVEQYLPFQPKRWTEEPNEQVYPYQGSLFLVVNEGGTFAYSDPRSFYAHCIELFIHGIPATCYNWTHSRWWDVGQEVCCINSRMYMEGRTLIEILDSMYVPF